MFYRTILSFSLFFALTSGIAYWDHIRLRPHDPHEYRQLAAEHSHSRHLFEKEPARQKRLQVQKDIWIPQRSQRLHFRLCSAQSELLLKDRKGKIEAVETLRDLECWVQEQMNLEQTVQLLRHFTASQGTYLYPSHQFLAENVHLQFFRLAGHELPEIFDPNLSFLNGFADEASFSVCGKSPTFSARRLRAELDPARGLP